MKFVPQSLFIPAIIVGVSLGQPAAGQTNFTLLKSFSGGSNYITAGVFPGDGVIQASDGCLYGTTLSGGSGTGSLSGGVIFKLQTNGSGFTVLTSFVGTNGFSPYARLTEGSDGNLYGTTYGGGLSNAGTVFRIAKNGTGFAILHHFTGGDDGANLYGPVIEGSDGYLYGMTYSGNSATRGTVFKVSKSGADYSILHAFTGSPDGQNPTRGLLKGSDGALYGTTVFGGTTARGTVFRIDENGSGYFIIRDITSNSSGYSPGPGLIEGSDHLLYGVNGRGGSGGGGNLYTLDFFGGGYTIICSFTNTGTGLQAPHELVEGEDGALYGASGNGGADTRGGIFKVNKDGSGYTVLRNFVGTPGGGDGDRPQMALLLGRDHVFYGTTEYGGPSGTGGAGTVFTLSTNRLAPRNLALSVLGNSGVIQFSGTGGAQYMIESSANLYTWSDLVTVTSPIHGVTLFTNSLMEPAAFFRVRLQ